tara:strand:- start:69 stop:401 length:333 start_codon:yes stop_codon:yes gene_type:complete
MKTRTMNELRQEKTYGYKAPFGMTHKEEKPKGYSEIDIETTKDLIFNSLKNKFYDMIFQAVCDEMSKHEVFQEETYFTPQGMDEFEDQWFEFYHEHHGDILGSIMKDFTN